MVINLAFDDPIVWILILGLVVFLFGSSKIPQFAKSLGQARREFENGWRGIASEMSASTEPVKTASSTNSVTPKVQQQTDPIVLAARNEGIDTRGKTRGQLAEELSWKLNKK